MIRLQGRFPIIGNGQYFRDLAFHCQVSRGMVENIRREDPAHTDAVESMVNDVAGVELKRIGFEGTFELGPGTLYESRNNTGLDPQPVAAVMI